MAHFYKNMKKTELKVGIFVTIGILILFFSYSWLNDWFLKGRNDTIQVLFDNVGNLEKGSAVYFRGLRVGRVSALRISNNGVIVEMSVVKDSNIDRNASFYIKDRDMMGTKMVDIIPGDSFEMINQSELYKGESLPGLVDLITSLYVLTDNLEGILSQIEVNEDFIEKFDRIFLSIENSLAGFEQFIININNSDIFIAFSEFKNISLRLEEMIYDTSNNLEITFTKLDSLLVSSTSFIDFLHENVNQEDGNLHRLINDVELYEKLLNSAKELEELIIDVKENPRKYFRFSVF